MVVKRATLKFIFHHQYCKPQTHHILSQPHQQSQAITLNLTFLSFTMLSNTNSSMPEAEESSITASISYKYIVTHLKNTSVPFAGQCIKQHGAEALECYII